MAISIDSAPVHANFGSSLGGISYPMLADFHPKGAMAESYGTYMGERGMCDRATVIVDANGVVRHASSIGQRDMAQLAEICEGIDKEHGAGLPEMASAPGLGKGTVAYVRDNCGASRAVLLAKANLHIESLEVRNVSQNAAFMAELKSATGAETAPVLVSGGAVVAESAAIVAYLAKACSAL